MKSVAAYVDEIMAIKTKEGRIRALNRVPEHKRADVEKWVKILWGKKSDGKRKGS
jgi:hypothetical protein